MSKIASIRWSDLLVLSRGALRRNRLRSTLTIGAIAVGISVMVYLTALGFGLEELTLGSVARSSVLLSLTVTSQKQDLLPLTSELVEKKIRPIPHTSLVLPELALDGEMILDNTRGPVTVQGVDPEYLELNDSTKLTVGRLYRTDDKQTMIVTTGFLKLFGLEANKTPLVDFTLQLNSGKFPGIAAVPNINVTGIVQNDTAVIVYIPRIYTESLVGDKQPPYNNVKVKVASTEDIQPVSDALIAQGFKVEKVVDTVDQIKQVFFWIRAVLVTLGLIAIVVATLGMFNTLTISLLERTKEIGIMKALGVKRKDIQRLFMTEAFLIGLIGGVTGILLALFFEQLTLFTLSILAALAKGTVPPIFLNYWYIIAGFMCFSLFIALVTGLYPARRAARINPIEAIRYE